MHRETSGFTADKHARAQDKHACARIKEAHGSDPAGTDSDRHVTPAETDSDRHATPKETQNVEPIYRRRPFVQVHVCHSGTNLIAAEIDATSEGWHRSVQAVGSYAGTLEPQQAETSLVQFLDSDIFPEFQTMKLVQSGLYSTAAQRSHDALDHLNPAEGLLSTNVLNNYAVGVLHDEVREMYQGNVFQTGNGFVRPRHLIHLVDAMRQLSGPVEVKEVTHTFGLQGFITTWSPDCVAFAQDSQKYTLVAHALQFGARYYASKAIMRAARTEIGSLRLKRGLRVTLSALSKIDEVVASTGGAGLRYLAYDLKRFGGGLLDRTPLARVGRSLGAFRAIDGLSLDRRQVFAALEKELGGINRLRQFRRSHLRVAKNAVLQKDKDALTVSIKNRVLAKRSPSLSPLSQEQDQQVTAYIDKVLYHDKNVLGLGSPALKVVDGSKASLADLDKPSFLRDMAEKIGSTSSHTPLQATLLEYLKTNARVRNASNRILRPQIKRASLEYLQELIGDKDPLLKDAFAHTLGAFAGKDHIPLSEVTGSLQRTIDALEKSIKARKASPQAVQDAEAIARDETRLRQAQSVLRRAQTTAQAAGGLARKTTTLVKTGKAFGALGKFTEAGKLAKIVGGPWELLMQVSLGGVARFINTRLSSRQALKVMPLQSCHKEWTAGMNGHLGSVVGDPLGPADNTIEFLLGEGPDTLQNSFLKKVLGPLAPSLGFNVAGTILGLDDPHYGTEDGTYQQLVAAYGLPLPQDQTADDVTHYNQEMLKRLARLNTVGPQGSGVTAETPISGDVTSVSVGPGESYADRTGSTVGQNYARVVHDLSLYLLDPSQNNKPQAVAEVDHDLQANACQKRMQRVMNAEGNTTSYYPRTSTAWEAAETLKNDPGYERYWQMVADAPTRVTDPGIPQGALCYWSPQRMGNSAGHVAVLYRYNNRVFLLGNSSGNTALDVL